MMILSLLHWPAVGLQIMVRGFMEIDIDFRFQMGGNRTGRFRKSVNYSDFHQPGKTAVEVLRSRFWEFLGRAGPRLGIPKTTKSLLFLIQALLHNLWVNLVAVPHQEFGDGSWRERRPWERQSPHCPDFFTMAGDHGFCPRFVAPGCPKNGQLS
jgi:hypothetical protein